MDSEWYDSIEILMLGDSSVGKTTFITGQHTNNRKVTTSVKITKIIFDDIKCKFYDTPGKQRYQNDIVRQLHQRQYPYQIVIYMFSYDDPQSLKNLYKWKSKFPLLQKAARTILIANKCELQKKFSDEDYKKVKQQIKPNAQYKFSMNIEIQSNKHSSNILNDIIRNFIQQENSEMMVSQDCLAIQQNINKSQILSNSIKSEPQLEQIKNQQNNLTKYKRPRPAQGEYQKKQGAKKIKPWYKWPFQWFNNKIN